MWTAAARSAIYSSKNPVEINKEKPLIIEIHSLSGNGVNDVGIRCTPEVWNILTNGQSGLGVRLKSSDKRGTKIGGVDLHGHGTGFLEYLTNVHYLFYIQGEHRAKASVEIIFPNTPDTTTPVEIILGKTPIDTKF